MQTSYFCSPINNSLDPIYSHVTSNFIFNRAVLSVLSPEGSSIISGHQPKIVETTQMMNGPNKQTNNESMNAVQNVNIQLFQLSIHALK